MINNMRNKTLENFLTAYVQDNYPELVNDPEFIRGLKLSAETFHENANNFSIFDILPPKGESIDFLDNELKKVFHSIKKIPNNQHVKVYNVNIGSLSLFFNNENIFLSYHEALLFLQSEVKKLIDSKNDKSLHRYSFNINEYIINKNELEDHFSEEYLINFYGENWK